jgi:hypothetical protein
MQMPRNGRTLNGYHASIRLVIGAALALIAGACANGPGTAVSPSGAAPSALDARGGAVKAFTVSVSPLSIAAGAATLTVTVTNDLSTNPTSLSLGSVQIVVPNGLAVTAVNSFSGSKSWGTSWTTGQTVVVGASNGTQKLAPGESVSFHIAVSAESCGSQTFANPAGSSETLGTFSADWTYLGTAPSVTVTNCVISECPAAPAIAGNYLRTQLRIHPNDDPYQNIVSQVALHMTQQAAFDGILPCEPGYAAAVIAFVDDIVN